MNATLEKLPAVFRCNSRYAVRFEGKDIGRLSKDDDSFFTQHKWKAWFGSLPGTQRYLGEFDTCEVAVQALVDLTKQQTPTKE